jgi:hypothetical protein
MDPAPGAAAGEAHTCPEDEGAARSRPAGGGNVQSRHDPRTAHFVIAAYNEALALPLLHPRLCAVLDGMPDIDGHILYVDDGSHDAPGR